MTLVAAHRLPKTAVVLSDLRLTERDRDPQGNITSTRHADNTLKFITIRNVLRLFPAGDVRFWQRVAASLEAVVDQVSVANVAERNAPFHAALDAAAGRTLPSEHSKGAGALGVVLDPVTGRNSVFKAVVRYGLGALVEEVPAGDVVLIGTGSQLHGLRDVVAAQADASVRRLAFDEEVWPDLNDHFCAIRDAIQNAYERAGPGAYAQFDTGPVFVGNLLNGGQLAGVGETVDHVELRGGVWTTTTYQLGVDDQGRAFVRDPNTGTHVSLDLLAESPARATGRTIDPQGRESAPPLQDTFAGREVVYRVNQRTYTAGGSGPLQAPAQALLPSGTLVQRDVQRIELATREVTTLATSTSTPDDDSSRYPRVVDHYFSLGSALRTAFEVGVEGHLFDEEWWRSQDPEASSRLYGE
jgi:hypothetical protein